MSFLRGGPPWIMGILNATPDSIAGDGLDRDVDAIVARGIAQVSAGAAILDVGGESTRPGATPVPEALETDRVVPPIRRLARKVDVPISVDTSKPSVAEAALDAGAQMVNDVSGLRDERIATVAAEHSAWLVVTHNGWTRRRPPGVEIVEAVCDELARLVSVAERAGVASERIVVDPGLGFGKKQEETLTLLGAIDRIRERLGPHLILVGPSRKGFVARAVGATEDDLRDGSLAAVTLAASLGAEIIRAHDVLPAVRAARLAAAVRDRVSSSRLAYVGLGANVGDTRMTLRRAVTALGSIGRVESVSGLWETAPREVEDQPRFLNAVAAVEMPRGSASEIVARLKGIEKELGRTEGPRYGPRVIDLDLLAFADGAAETDRDVVVPHPRLAERRFALAPLAEIAPELIEPRSGRTIRELASRVADQEATRLEGSEWWTG